MKHSLACRFRRLSKRTSRIHPLSLLSTSSSISGFRRALPRSVSRVEKLTFSLRARARSLLAQLASVAMEAAGPCCKGASLALATHDRAARVVAAAPQQRRALAALLPARRVSAPRFSARIPASECRRYTPPIAAVANRRRGGSAPEGRPDTAARPPRDSPSDPSPPSTSDAGPDEIVEAADRLGVPKVSITRGMAKLFRSGSPIVFPNSVAKIDGRRPRPGDAVAVTDGAWRSIGWGVYNSRSHYRVRILESASEVRARCAPGSFDFDVRGVVEARIQAAIDTRRAMGLPSADTDVYRLINSEGDRLSGLVVDRPGSTLVAAPSAVWVEQMQEHVLQCLKRATGIEDVVWRPAADLMAIEMGEEGTAGSDDALIDAGDDSEGASQSTDGATASSTIATASSTAHATASPANHAATATAHPTALSPDRVAVVERSVRYWAAPRGQKTGFYADQRDSRAFIRDIAAGKTVLDLCCYSGGFALSACAGGASSCLGVDSSQTAVDLATANAELNNFTPQQCRFVRSDVESYMKEAAATGEKFDIVILDPPKLAPSRQALDRASRKYAKLNVAAGRLVKPGGVLMTCSCSGAMTQSDTFMDVVCGALNAAGRRAAVVRVAGAGPDHVLDPFYPEGRYLTNVTLVLP